MSSRARGVSCLVAIFLPPSLPQLRPPRPGQPPTAYLPPCVARNNIPMTSNSRQIPSPQALLDDVPGYSWRGRSLETDDGSREGIHGGLTDRLQDGGVSIFKLKMSPSVVVADPGRSKGQNVLFLKFKKKNRHSVCTILILISTYQARKRL